MDWKPQDPEYVNAGMADGYLCKYPKNCEYLQDENIALRSQLEAAQAELKDAEEIIEASEVINDNDCAANQHCIRDSRTMLCQMCDLLQAYRAKYREGEW